MSHFINAIRTILVGGARIDLQNVRFGDDIRLDELHLDGGEVRIEGVDTVHDSRITAGETRVRAMMSETNLNRLVAASLPPDAPVRSIEIVLLSGRARISGKAVMGMVPIPFSVEAVPRIENGVRVTLECQTASLGVSLPRAVVDVLDQKIGELLRLDVSALEIPLWIDEIRCEPGRLTAMGRARIVWPPQGAISAPRLTAGVRSTSGFTVSAEPLFGRELPARPAISAAPTEGHDEAIAKQP